MKSLLSVNCLVQQLALLPATPPKVALLPYAQNLANLLTQGHAGEGFLDKRHILTENAVENRVAVGTIIVDRPPRRSVRALLTHTALTSDAWRQSAR